MTYIFFITLNMGAQRLAINSLDLEDILPGLAIKTEIPKLLQRICFLNREAVALRCLDSHVATSSPGAIYRTTFGAFCFWQNAQRAALRAAGQATSGKPSDSLSR